MKERNMGRKKTHQILVTGDVTLDKNICKGNRQSPENKEYGTKIYKQYGGAYIIYEILSKMTETLNSEIEEISKRIIINDAAEENSDKKKQLNELKNTYIKKRENWEIKKVNFGLKNKIFNWKYIPKSLVTYATWQYENYAVPVEFAPKLPKEIKAWKVLSPMGFGTDLEEDKKKEIKIENLYNEHRASIKFDNGLNKLLIFDDSGNNFRRDEKAWKLYLDEFQEKQEVYKNMIILKTAYPLTRGKLFNELTNKFNDQLMIITSIDEIRKEDVLISKGISWEQTALDLVEELKKGDRIHKLLNCRFLVINFNSEGALYLQMKNNKIWECRLIFDPEYLEGEWRKINKLEGSVIGINDVFTSGIAYGILIEKDLEKIKLEKTINRSLSVIKLYELIGHGSDETKAGFPFKQLCLEIIEPTLTYASAFVPIPDDENILCNCDNDSHWTILEGNYWEERKDFNPKPLYDTGCRYALLGEGELANAPILRIKDFVTYDRWEIEALRNITNLIDDYISNNKTNKPLSLGVFGSPGSGKSFAVKNIAKSKKLEFLEFNLSQFVDVHELEGAFHRVRDIVLEGNTPVVFWDEFDSQEYRWLQYLLAPMQDGKFQEGRITHPIGKCIFVFAGATSYTFESFGVKQPVYPDPKDPFFDEKKIKYEFDLKGHNDFILKKGPDFTSRLSGYLNVKGPNETDICDQNVKVVKHDLFFPIRRALFIRNILGLKPMQELNMDFGLINALIKTESYKFGSRSLQQILSYLRAIKSDRYQRSSLPACNILKMAVDYNNFIKKLNEGIFYRFKSYSIAPEIHNNWKTVGSVDSDYRREYNHLTAHLKDENIAAANRIPDILKAAGCKITMNCDAGVIKFNKDILLNGIDTNNKSLKEIIKKTLKIEDIMKETNVVKKNCMRIEALNKFKDDFALVYKLAVIEHKSCVKVKTLCGWKNVESKEERNDDRKLHYDLKNFDDLSAEEFYKDIDSICNIEDNLKKVGLYIKEMIHRVLLIEISKKSGKASWQNYDRKDFIAKKLGKDELEKENINSVIQIGDDNYLIEGFNIRKEERIFNTDYEIKNHPENGEDVIFKPKFDKVQAVKIDKDFIVEHPIMGILKGKSGDYLVKSDQDVEQTFPEVWIVHRDFFDATIKNKRE